MISRFGRSLMFVVFAMARVPSMHDPRDISLSYLFYLQLALSMIALMHPPSRAYIDPWSGQLFGEGGVEKTLHSEDNLKAPLTSVKGGVIMSRLGNETVKAALGRSTWKLLHTTTLRFPEHPTPEEREALSSYFYLTSRLYPCGECAAEFQELLRKYPPQTSSRRAASLWLCFIHNEVNKRLKKTEFDCSRLSDEYDCGCGDQPISIKDTIKTRESVSNERYDPMDLEDDSGRDRMTGADMVRGGR